MNPRLEKVIETYRAHRIPITVYSIPTIVASFQVMGIDLGDDELIEILFEGCDNPPKAM